MPIAVLSSYGLKLASRSAIRAGHCSDEQYVVGVNKSACILELLTLIFISFTDNGVVIALYVESSYSYLTSKKILDSENAKSVKLVKLSSVNEYHRDQLALSVEYLNFLIIYAEFAEPKSISSTNPVI